jgi:hypothetical protein
MIESCSKLYENIKCKQQINDCVDNQEISSFHFDWLETQFKWNTEGIVEGQNDNEQLPVCLPGVILTDHENVVLVSHPIVKFFKYLFGGIPATIEPLFAGFLEC